MRQIKHVQQEDPNGCGIACVAMVADSYYEAIKDLAVGVPDIDDTGVNIWGLENLLTLLDIEFEHQLYPRLEWNSTYIVVTPSLNRKGISHYIVLQTNTQEIINVYDPNKGITDIEYYTIDNLKSWSEVTKVLSQ
jgi:ABC-type bacteriocin/lantibiotic exporter with double-glycine peptidase domain